MSHYHLAQALAAVSTGSGAADLAQTILGYGIIGLILIDILLTRRLVGPAWRIRELEAELAAEKAAHAADIAKAEAKDEQTFLFLRDKVVPALESANKVNEELLRRAAGGIHDR